MNRRDVLASGLAALTGQALASGAALAESRYPDHPIRLVIPFTPGGVNDAVGRPWADRMKSLAGLPDIVHIPYRGGGPLIADLVAGHIPMIAQSVTAGMIDLHRSGKVRMLCVTSPQRLAAFPSLPTAVEAGLPNMVAQNFIGL